MTKTMNAGRAETERRKPSPSGGEQGMMYYAQLDCHPGAVVDEAALFPGAASPEEALEVAGAGELEPEAELHAARLYGFSRGGLYAVSTGDLFRVLVSGLEDEDHDEGEDEDGQWSELLAATAADLGFGARVSDAEARRVIEPLFCVAEEGRLAALHERLGYLDCAAETGPYPALGEYAVADGHYEDGAALRDRVEAVREFAEEAAAEFSGNG